MKGIKDFEGFSESGIYEAIQNALKKAGDPANFEVIETLGSQRTRTKRQYQVKIKTECD